MSMKHAEGPKALVLVLDDMETAKQVIEKLVSSGFDKRKIELVGDDIGDEAPEVTTPRNHETTESSLIDSASTWGGAGAGTGLAIGMLTGFPGLALGMAIMGGVTGAIVGGIAGVDHAVEDDSVDLPTLDEYDQFVKNGEKLVVVLGHHKDMMRAEEIVKSMLHVRTHIHPVHGHLYHEHPANRTGNS